jgi:hypothetical protein
MKKKVCEELSCTIAQVYNSLGEFGDQRFIFGFGVNKIDINSGTLKHFTN